MNNKYLKKCIAVILSGAVSAGVMCPIVFAEPSDLTVTVTATATADNAFLVNEQNLVVESDTAENYGYTDSVNMTDGVSALDVLVKMHEVKYGDDFTNETAADYFSLSGSGWITTAFASDEYAGYSINHEYATTLTVKMFDGDTFEFFFNQEVDEYWWMDFYVHLDNFTAAKGQELTLNATGSVYAYGYGPMPLEDAQIAFVNDNGSLSVNESEYSDEDGNINITFDEVGTYYITLTGIAYSEYNDRYYEAPVIPSITRVTVIDETIYDAYTSLTEDYLARDLAYGDEWIALGLARGSFSVDSKYYSSVLKAIKNNGLYYQGKPSVSNYARTILSLTAMGKNVGDELLDVLSSYALMEDLYESYMITSVATALIALDSNDYKIPVNEGDQNTREGMVNLLIDALGKDDAYLYGVDSAVMIVQALAPYCDNAEVKEVVDAAVETIRTTADTNVNLYTDYCSMYAQLAVMYAALGDDPTVWVNKMMKYYSEDDKMFTYMGTANEMSTYQAYYALAAYMRYLTDKNPLYNMSDAFYSIKNAGGFTYMIYSPFKNTEADVIGASYTDEVLDDVSITNVSLRRGNNTVVSEGDKIMLWNSVNGMIPLCKAQ